MKTHPTSPQLQPSRCKKPFKPIRLLVTRMKNPMLKKIASLCLVLSAGVLSARADALYWDQAGSGALGGTGTWNLNSTANWWNGAADVTWKDNSATGTNSAIFAGTAGTVTLNTGLSASNLQFTASGYTLLRY